MPDAWIRQWSDPVLRERAQPVGDVDDLMRHQLARMGRLLPAADGAGLAATQVGVLRRAFVYRLGIDAPVRALVDPVIVDAADEQAAFVEGCLSFLSITVTVQRPIAVRVRGLDAAGDEVELEAEGPAASLLQHEIDHLDGVLTLDRSTPVERRRALSALTYAAAAASRSSA